MRVPVFAADPEAERAELLHDHLLLAFGFRNRTRDNESAGWRTFGHRGKPLRYAGALHRDAPSMGAVIRNLGCLLTRSTGIGRPDLAPLPGDYPLGQPAERRPVVVLGENCMAQPMAMPERSRGG